MTPGTEFWRPCSSCKKPIGFRQVHWTCSVSTCTRRNTNFVFCSVECWDKHVPLMNHREAWAEERRAPKREDWEKEHAEAEAAAQRKEEAVTEKSEPQPLGEAPIETLVVASKLKAYVRARAGFNTSDRVIDLLSEKLRRIADAAIENARADGRKTVLDRDIP